MNKIEQIKAEIERRRSEFINKGKQTSRDAEVIRGVVISECSRLLAFIYCLPEEKPCGDLEQEIDKYTQPIQAWEVQEAPFSSLDKCARHFYELGLNARKEE